MIKEVQNSRIAIHDLNQPVWEGNKPTVLENEDFSKIELLTSIGKSVVWFQNEKNGSKVTIKAMEEDSNGVWWISESNKLLFLPSNFQLHLSFLPLQKLPLVEPFCSDVKTEIIQMPLSLSSTTVTNFEFSKDSQYVSYTFLNTTSDLKNATVIVKLDGKPCERNYKTKKFECDDFYNSISLSTDTEFTLDNFVIYNKRCKL